MKAEIGTRATLLAVVAVVVAVVAGTASAAPERGSAGSLKGAGSSFVFPLVSQWAPGYDSATGTTVNYDPIGSGGGITAITNRTVDFGASDAPLSPDQFSACKGCVQIPWALSATAVAYNLPGVRNNLRANGRILAGIYKGTITKWNDPAIRRLNPGVNLPSTDITPVHRSDNSGTSYNFTEYLSSVDADWRSRFGKGVNVNWPAGPGARGSSGVAGVVARTTGAVGYFDIAYAKANKLQFFAVQNRSGKYALPGLRGIRAAAESDPTVGANNEMSIVNPPKRFTNAYPIATYTYVIVPLRTDKAAELRRFVFWALTKGQTYGPRLLFQPIPKHVLVAAERTLKRVQS
ncbi:MAG: phosphate ABC transporter substrate-binding protein PstS [Pseudomonadota bacterium]